MAVTIFGRVDYGAVTAYDGSRQQQGHRSSKFRPLAERHGRSIRVTDRRLGMDDYRLVAAVEDVSQQAAVPGRSNYAVQQKDGEATCPYGAGTLCRRGYGDYILRRGSNDEG